MVHFEVGRKSTCMGDDASAPNIKYFEIDYWSENDTVPTAELVTTVVEKYGSIINRWGCSLNGTRIQEKKDDKRIDLVDDVVLKDKNFMYFS